MVTRAQPVFIPTKVAVALQSIIGTTGERDFQAQFDKALGLLLGVYDSLSPKQKEIARSAAEQHIT